uniref:T9SS type B sorting domain-containing protein n=1 Tax=uncultured Aquimarina sp. TaxID=575652 RepID=UPI0026131A4C
VCNLSDDNASGDNSDECTTAGFTAGTSLAPENTDTDMTPDYQDTDSDNDGTSDVVEAGQDLGNGLTTDTDGDGLLDAFDDSDDTGTTPDVNDNLDTGADGTDNDDVPGTAEVDFREILDSDNDGIADNIDEDDDNDGIPDVVESDGNDPSADDDGDGIPNYQDVDPDGLPGTPDLTDSNNDGIPDIYDNDNDGVANHLDLDSDNDGIYDIVETGNAGLDSDDDGIADGDVGADGIPDSAQGNVDGDPVTTNPSTSDGDATPDYLDIDADDDGIPDNVEAQPTASYTPPSGNDNDNDGIDDAYDPVCNLSDDNASGDNSDECTTAGFTAGTSLAPENTDTDMTPDYQDTDSDNDGTSDVVEAGQDLGNGLTTDTDGDGLLDAFDDSDDTGTTPDVNDNLDTGADGTDNDDVPGTAEVDFREILDSDNDGIADNIDEDDDNDGIPDVVESDGNDPSGDDDNDGIPNYADVDTNNDGTPDLTDSNNDGIPDIYDNDNDGVPNHLDLDSDNDGIYDIVETGNGALDTDNDGQINGSVGMNGIPDTAEDGGVDGAGVSGTPTDTDGNPNDGPDYLDIDADDDGIVDNIEGQTTAGYIAPIVDDPLTPLVDESDTDGNGVNDAYDTNGTAIDPTNTDGLADGPDYIDLNSDEDSESDTIEAYDTDDDGIADTLPAGIDADGDGLDDNFDTDDASLDPTNGGQTADNPFPNTDNPTTPEPDWRDTDDQVDLVVAKTVDNGTPDEGSTIVYTITITNNGAPSATNINITDQLPVGVTYVSDTPSQGTYDDVTGIWTIGDITNGNNATLAITTTVDAETSGDTITNTITVVNLDQTDNDITPDDPSEDIIVNNEVDLVIAKIVDNAAPDEGDTINYTITVTNNGPAAATNVSLTDVLPVGVTFVSANPAADYNSAIGVWNIGDILDGGVETLIITATVDVGTSGDTITNTVTAVNLDQIDNNTTTDDPSEDIIVNNEVDLVVAKTVDNATPDEGDTINYTITVTNNGPARATTVSITDQLPIGVTYVSDTPSQGTYDDATGVWTIGDIDESTVVTLVLEATVDAGTSDDTITNTVTGVTLDQTDNDTTPDDPSEDITINNEVDLVVAKTVDNATPDEGDTINYTITVTNNGPARAMAVSITDQLPTGVTYVSDTPSQGTYDDATGVWTIGDIDDSTVVNLILEATVDVGTSDDTITNTVTGVTLDQTDNDTTPDDPSEDIVVNNEVDLVIAKTVDNATPDEGDTINYTITVTNNGPARATTVSITDQLPVGVTYISDTPSQGTYDDATGIWTVGDMDNGNVVTLILEATVDAETSGDTITNTVTGVTLDQTDNDITPDDPSEDIIINNEVDLVITKTVDNATPDEGGTVNYTITVTNNGPARATTVSITDQLPVGVTYISDTPSQGTYDDATGIWTVGDMDNGNVVTLILEATVDAGTSNDTITNTVTGVTLDQTDTNTTPDDPSEDITVNNDTDLVISKTIDNSTPNEGETITYTITVTNNGVAQATALVVNDPLPAGVTYASDAPSQGNYAPASGDWDVGTLNNGATATIDIQVSVDAGTSGDTIINAITVTSDQNDPDTTNNDLEETIMVTNIADLVISKTVDDNNPNEGDTINYSIIVRNDGTEQATQLTVNDLLPAGITYVSDAPTTGTYDNVTGDWVIGTLDAGVTAILTITATVDTGTSGTTINNVITFTMDQTDPDLTNNDLEEEINVVSDIDLVVSKSIVEPGPYVLGGIYTYSITIANSGPAQATNVAITDQLPTGITYISDIPDQGIYDNVTGIWSVGTIPPDEIRLLTINFSVDAGTSGTSITNVITNVTLDQVDLNIIPDDLDETIIIDGDNDDDGISDSIDIDDDNDGILDVVEGTGDTDGDGISDAFDQDSDNDGIPDNVEGQTTDGYISPTGNDSDGDGLDDAYEGTGDEGVTPEDTDGDGTPDYLDDDSDNDGIPDEVEGFDYDNDGIPDTLPIGEDVDNDGLDDAYDGDTTGYGDPNGDIVDADPDTDLNNTDGEEEPDYRDTDDDGDGVDTVEENYDGDDDPSDTDTDGDGIPDYIDTDDDGDGIDTVDENPDPNGDGNPDDAIDTDGDGDPDYLDTNAPIDPDAEDGIEIFTGISPNGDGINDVFVIRGIENFENTVEIYNRWGVKVYSTDNYGRNDNFFRGISNGRTTVEARDELPVGTYYYVLEYILDTGERKNRAGYLYINK